MGYVTKKSIKNLIEDINNKYCDLSIDLFPADRNPDLWSDEEKELYDRLNSYFYYVIEGIKNLWKR
jgi:hypothetical protein